MAGIHFVKSQPNTDKHSLAGQYTMPKEIENSLERESEVADKAKEDEKNSTLKYQNRRYMRDLDGEELKRNLKEDSSQDAIVKRVKVSDISDGYRIPAVSGKEVKALSKELVQDVPGVRDLQFFRPADAQHFAPLLDGRDDAELTKEEQQQRQILRLVLRIKNGMPASRKEAIRTLSDRALDFGAHPLFSCILPIILDRNLEDQERHLMLKAVGLILFKLNESVRPYTHKILIVTTPMLVDEDELVRNSGMGIISNLSRAAGLATMISTLQPDTTHNDEYIRNTTARAIAVVAKSFGMSQLIPFIRAVCYSKSSWKARHTGIKTVQQLSVLMGIGILPYLNELIECIYRGLSDQHPPVRIIAAQTVASLAQNSYPYGIEAFNCTLEPIWKGVRTHRGKILSSFLKALGYIIPLMDSEYAGYYTEEVMRVVKREFTSPDDEMKKTVLQVIQKVSTTDGVTPRFLSETVLPHFFSNFWVRRIALDPQINKIVTYTTVVLSSKVGCSYILENLLSPLRDEAEPFRTMAAHAINRIVLLTGTVDIEENLERRLVDALLIAFQEQTNNDRVVFRCIGTVANSLHKRMKQYLGPIVSTILNRLKHKNQTVRQYAAELCGVLVPVISSCGELQMLNKLNIIFFESLGEVYPEVLGSIISAMDKITSVVSFKSLQPPVNQILPTLTPILRNRHRKVQESTITLVGRIANRGPEYVPPKEWMRICFELLELLKSPAKSIRKAANTTFGYIAKAIGPHDVLVALLNNLKVQERQLRVCTAVAIGIVAETCAPFTVLPAIMNEYKIPDTNVQNGILKALAFMFEYIGGISKDYLYVISPLLQDALVDRDLVHRQTASTVVRHLALGCMGHGYEDMFIHMLNLLIPNIFETSPHAIFRILESIEALRYALGPSVFMNYVWAGLFHPARNVRKVYWHIYNISYVAQLDAIVPYYPTSDDDRLTVTELELVI
ncbi:HEL084Wp [Eremothecium sinecaudum]|uniref:HEL084Wp n=1 Tax=Eremothecium sinecaudum TaxID=45286 RepID=A0A109UZF9_9SACH|nr:HEL084Wp [Eremothecium sinecaudum]AMD21196.1 HEL084Wp [Eremothecium sinecaudum]